MKKISLFLGMMLIAASFLLSNSTAKATSETIVDKEFTPGYNYYGRDNSVFLSACTRFTPNKSTYASYIDLAVKNDQGASYPIRASLRAAGWSDEAPNEASLKTYTQATFNNYAMGQGFSRFNSSDGNGPTLTPGIYYWICIDDLANNNATGWFYTNPVSGGYTRMGYPGDVQTPFNGTFGYKTYAIESSTPSGDPSGGTTTGTTTGNSSSKTTGNSNIAVGSAPSAKISSAITKPTNLAAAYSTDAKAVIVTWKASTTTTIGGYNIYRSTTSGKDYKKIADTGKITVTYSDSKINANTTYYYMVRAYKDDYESASSDEASALVPADAAVASKNLSSTSDSTATNNKFEMTPLLWILSAAAVLLLGILILLILRRKRLTKETASTPKPLK